jgi:hypothetical protein
MDGGNDLIFAYVWMTMQEHVAAQNVAKPIADCLVERFGEAFAVDPI